MDEHESDLLRSFREQMESFGVVDEATQRWIEGEAERRWNAFFPPAWLVEIVQRHAAWIAQFSPPRPSTPEEGFCG